DVQRLLARMAALDPAPGPDETAVPANVREALLDTGREAALRLGRWIDALNLNAARAASLRARSPPAVETARAIFNDYFPLLRLGRTEQALDLLQECARTFQDARDPAAIGTTLSALADAEHQRGRGDAAGNL